MCLVGSSNWSVASSANCDFGVQIRNPGTDFLVQWKDQFDLHFARGKEPDVVEEERSRSPSRSRAERSVERDYPPPEEVDDPEAEHLSAPRRSEAAQPSEGRGLSSIRRRLVGKTTPRLSSNVVSESHRGRGAEVEGDRDSGGAGSSRVSFKAEDPRV